MQSHCQRKQIRLREYDYCRAGFYFVTVCTWNREPLLGSITTAGTVGAGSKPALIKNASGQIVEDAWFDLPNHNPGISLHEFIVMPNHIHGIIEIDRTGLERAGLEPAPTVHPLSEIVRQFKTFSGRKINEYRDMNGVPVWQRNYYEHIIRSDDSYKQIAQYIENNPAQWREDELFVGR